MVWIIPVGISYSKGNEKRPLSSESGSYIFKDDIHLSKCGSSLQVYLHSLHFTHMAPRPWLELKTQERTSLRGWPHYMLSASAKKKKKKNHKNPLFRGHKVILGIKDNTWWVKDQCGRNTCSSVIKHNGSPDTFSHSVLAVTLQCCYVPWLMILHYKSFQNLVE